jgi:hypothetical protein
MTSSRSSERWDDLDGEGEVPSAGWREVYEWCDVAVPDRGECAGCVRR